MAYRHYETRGLILNARASGEANRLYAILTPDFGLVRVLAQGVRREKSKLRYQLQNFSAEVTLIKGREYWRLVGVRATGAPANPRQISFCRRVSSVLLRLIHGEEASPLIFNDVDLAWRHLAVTATASAPAEIFALVRILSRLGYLAPATVTAEILAAEELTLDLIATIAGRRRALIGEINASLSASGL